MLCAELVERVTEQVFAEPEASVEVAAARVLITSVSLALHVENEFLKKEAESGEDSSVKLLSTMDAFYVVATVMTTIGYGNLSPVSYKNF